MGETAQYLATGRRKTSVARVFLRPGSGKLVVNRRPFENYFPSEALRAEIRQPLLATDTAVKFDVLIVARGGGVEGQAGGHVCQDPITESQCERILGWVGRQTI